MDTGQRSLTTIQKNKTNRKIIIGGNTMIQNEHIEDRIILPRVVPRGESYNILLVVHHRALELDIQSLVGLEGLETLRNNHQELLCLEGTECLHYEDCSDVVMGAKVYTLPCTGGRELYIDELLSDGRHAQMKLVSINEGDYAHPGCIGVIMKK